MLRAFAAALAAASSALLIALPASGAQPHRPATLRLAALTPVAVTGRSFEPRESVLLILRAENGQSRIALARATSRGRFRATFRIRLTRCDSFVIRATGSNGTRAVLEVERDCEEKKRGRPEPTPREKKKPRGGRD